MLHDYQPDFLGRNSFSTRNAFLARNAFSVKYGCLARIELICYILVRIIFKSEIIIFFRIGSFGQNRLFSQNWLFGKIWLIRQIIFFARNVFLAEIAVQQKMLFGQKYFCQVWTGFVDRDGFLARIVFLPNVIKKSYFSKYWKVWLAFDGWKLSGLFLHILRQGLTNFV